MNEKNLSEFILTKFCHDIAGNVGAVLNGCELLAESSDDAEFVKEASEALMLSAKSVADRVRFFRMAFGRTSNDFSLSSIVEITKSYIATLNNITLFWEPLGNDTSSVARVKMILCQVASGCLVKGGKLEVGENSVRAVGERAFLNPKLKALLAKQMPEDFSSAEAPLLFLMTYIEENALRIECEEAEGEVIFKVFA